MKVLVINLDNRPDRIAHIQRELSKVGLPYERMRAVEAADCAPHGVLRPEEVACYLSHVACWQNFLASDEEYCLVLEDDVVFAPSAKEILSDLSWWIDGVDIVKIETMAKFGGPLRLDAKGVSIMPGRQLRYLRGLHFGTAAYIMSRRGASRAMAHFATPLVQIDHALFAGEEECPLSVQQMIPAPAQQLCLFDGHKSSAWRSTIHPQKYKVLERKLSERMDYWYLEARDRVRCFVGLQNTARVFVDFG